MLQHRQAYQRLDTRQVDLALRGGVFVVEGDVRPDNAGGSGDCGDCGCWLLVRSSVGGTGGHRRGTRRAGLGVHLVSPK